MVLGFTMKAVVEANGIFEKDKKDIKISQSNLALMQIIGDNIKAAGENIGEPLFPVIEIKPNIDAGAMVGSSKLVIRRGVVPALVTCNPIIVAYTSTIIQLNGRGPGSRCELAMSYLNPITNNLPSPVTRSFKLTQARKYRCSQDNPSVDYSVLDTDFCEGNSDETALAFVVDKLGNYRTFNYIGDTFFTGFSFFNAGENLNISNLSASFPNAMTVYPDRSSIYIVQERSYTLDSSGVVSVEYDRSGVKLPLIDKIGQFVVSARVYSNQNTQLIDPVDGTGKLPLDRRCVAGIPAYICKFNTAVDGSLVPIADNWKNLAGVRVRLVAKYDSRGDAATAADPAKLEATGEFFPRNVLSH